MLSQIAIGSLLVVATTVVHAGCTVVALRMLERLHATDRGASSRWRATGAVSLLVLLLFWAPILEALLWAAGFVWTGRIAGWEPALYFSIVTYTTLGYGDMTLGDSGRLMASFEAANGILIFGWSTALVVAFLHRVRARSLEAEPASRPR